MLDTLNRYRTWLALLTSAAVLAIAVGIGLDRSPGVATAATLERASPAEAPDAVRPHQGTSDADIDAVPGLRAQLARQAEAASGEPRLAGGAQGTSDADIDAVPGLRAQLERQAEASGESRRARVAHGTTDADIDAVPGLRAQLARHVESGPAASPAVGTEGSDAVLDARGAVGLAAVVALAGLAAVRLRRRDGYSHGIG